VTFTNHSEMPPELATVAPPSSSPAPASAVRARCSASAREGRPGTAVGTGQGTGVLTGGSGAAGPLPGTLPGAPLTWPGIATAHPAEPMLVEPVCASVQGRPGPRRTVRTELAPVTLHPEVSPPTMPSSPRARARRATRLVATSR
jgi:hypothetical protein